MSEKQVVYVISPWRLLAALLVIAGLIVLHGALLMEMWM